jgi:hypothetical protein
VAAHTLTHEGRKPLPRGPGRNGLQQLGWFHFWLLSAILGGMLALTAMVFLLQTWGS